MQKVARAQSAADAAKAVETAKTAVKVKAAEAQKAERGIKAAETAQKRAEAQVKYYERQIATARSEAQADKARAAHAKALLVMVEATTTAGAIKAAVAGKKAAASEAVTALKTAEAASVAAIAASRTAAREVEPISVFVSRRAGRIYIRQARQPVVDFPIAVKDPGKPIGTHIFTAMRSSDADTRLVWNAVAVESPSLPEQKPTVVGKGRHQKVVQPLPYSDTEIRNSALAALERIEIPQPVLDRVLPYVQVGSSLLISDLPPSIETGPSTDFVVLTKGEAEAVASIQKFVAEQREKQREERSDRRRRSRDDDDD